MASPRLGRLVTQAEARPLGNPQHSRSIVQTVDRDFPSLKHAYREDLPNIQVIGCQLTTSVKRNPLEADSDAIRAFLKLLCSRGDCPRELVVLANEARVTLLHVVVLHESSRSSP